VTRLRNRIEELGERIIYAAGVLGGSRFGKG
jgi:hypothetical protein